MGTCRNCGDTFRLYLFLDYVKRGNFRSHVNYVDCGNCWWCGCSLACFMNDKLSKDRTYVHVIMSDNLEAMKKLREFLAEHHITNVAADSYTLDWNTKTITITAYPETKAESRLINEYIEKSQMKFKRVVQPG